MSFTSSISSRQITKVLEVIGDIFQEENIKICAKESVKGGLITGVSTLIGGFLGGKTGLLTGGLIGAVAAYNMAPNYKSLLEVIHELDYENQKKLFDVVQNVVKSINIDNVVKFTLLLTTNRQIKQTVIRETINFICNELSMQITQD